MALSEAESALNVRANGEVVLNVVGIRGRFSDERAKGRVS